MNCGGAKSQDSNQEPQMRKRKQSPNRELNLHLFTSLMHYARPSRLAAKWNCGTEDVFRMSMHCILLRLQQPFFFLSTKSLNKLGGSLPDVLLTCICLPQTHTSHSLFCSCRRFCRALHLVFCLTSFHREYRLWWSGWRKWLGDWQP